MIPVQGKNARALLAQKLAPRSFVKTKLSFKLVPGMAPRKIKHGKLFLHTSPIVTSWPLVLLRPPILKYLD